MPSSDERDGESGEATEVLLDDGRHGNGVSFKAVNSHNGFKRQIEDPMGDGETASHMLVEEGGTERQDGERGREGDEEDSHQQPPSPLREILECPAEKRARRISHLVAYFTTFIMSIGFSIVLTGVWPYLQQLEPGVSKEALGWVIAANPLGQMIASPLLGLWGNKAGSFRGAFLLTVFTFTLGNGLYAVLHAFGSAAKAVMIFSRFLVGISSANIAIIRSYIAASTRVKERTTAVTLTSAAMGLGFIFGPAIQTALAVAFSKSDSSDPEEGGSLEEEEPNSGIVWNMYTATGWVGVFLGIINFILFMPCIFKEHRIASKEAELQMRKNNDDSIILPKPDKLALVNVLFSFFIFLMTYVLLETLLVPMCIDMYAWTDEMAVTVVGIGLSIAGASSVFTFLLAGYLSKRFDERKVYIFLGIVPMTVALLLHIPMGSTYPKIKNCTSTLPSTMTTAPSMDTLSLNLTDEIKFAVTEASYDKVTIGGISWEGNTKEEEEAATMSHIDDMNIPSTNATLRRRRRHLVTDNSCIDVGCPPEQKWCFYTPIIEKPQLIVATAVALFGYPIAFTLSSAIFSKILGPKPQGVWMGILTSTGSLSRVTGPILVTYMYTDLGPRWTFLILFFIMLLTLISNSALFYKLKPMKVTNNS